MTDSNDELMMETMYWWGIPTLFRCENRKDVSNCDIALVLNLYITLVQNLYTEHGMDT